MITELKPTNLIAVEVPETSYDFQLFEKDNKQYLQYYNNQYWQMPISMEGTYKVLGQVTKDKIGFDVEPYLEKGKIPADLYWKDYNWKGNHTNDRFNKTSVAESLYSLLAANGLYFENPMGIRQIHVEGAMEGDIDGEMWQSYENRLIKGKLLILEIL